MFSSSIFLNVHWHEIQCTYEQQQLAANMAEFLKKYIHMAASLDGLSPKVPLYKVTERNEHLIVSSLHSFLGMQQKLLYQCCKISYFGVLCLLVSKCMISTL